MEMEVPRHWRLKKQRYSLVGEVCNSCKTPIFPPRAVCPHCGGDAKQELAYQDRQPVLTFEDTAASLAR
jgi:uncharacterized OB-fold protein